LRQCKFRAGRAQAVDHLNGHDLSGTNGLFALGNMAVDDLVEAEMSPQPETQPNVAEPAGVGPPHGFQADPDDVGIVWQGDLVVVGEETEVTSFSLPVMKPDGALPAGFLVVVELAEMADDAPSRSRLGAAPFPP